MEKGLFNQFKINFISINLPVYISLNLASFKGSNSCAVQRVQLHRRGGVDRPSDQGRGLQ